MEDLTVPKNNIHTKTTFASDAMYKALLGQEVAITVNELGTEVYMLHQVDQFTIVAETEDGRFMLISKAAIIAIEAPDTSLPAFHEAIAEGVKRIMYKASKPRTDSNKHKPFVKKPHFQRPQHNAEPQARTVAVTVKPKRSYE